MRKKLIFHIGHSSGFYSEFNNMVLAILYCQRHDIDFHIYSSDANFGYQKGWCDFFQPFCNESQNPIHHFINHRFEAPKGGHRRQAYKIYKKIFPNIYLTSDLWNAFRHIDQTELTTDATKSHSAAIINEIYRFNAPTQESINNILSRIHLKDPYIGFHIRRGDKDSEHKATHINDYISKAESTTDIRQAFVSTDDYRIFEELCEQYPQWEFYTITPCEKRGYYHQQFLKLQPEEKRRDLITMFASMELLCRAKYSFCTFSSNIGMFLGMRIGDRAIGIDMPHWMIW